jgi:flavin-dependent dehydrogenase
MHDVIVVGSRVAGATTAMLLARAGHGVLVLERNRFPSDTMSTHYVHQPAIARLARWGLLDQLASTGCPPLDRARWRLDGLDLEGCAPAADGIRTAYGPRRFVLDTLLARAAVEAGAELRTGCNVTSLLHERGRVVGVRFGDGERRYEQRARVVVGADGIRSAVAAAVGAQRYDEEPTRTCLYYTYWSGLPACYEVYVRDRRAIGVVPTNDSLTMVGVAWPREAFAEVRRDVESQYLRALKETAPELYERAMAGHREERFVGTGHLPNFFRESAGPGWALVGDAGYHKDPAGAYGISDAFRHAELLASELDAGLAGRSDLDQAIRGYAERRDADSQASYLFNLELARLELAPELLDILAAVRHDQTEVDRFFGMIAAVITPQEFLTEELIERALAANSNRSAVDGR